MKTRTTVEGGVEMNKADQLWPELTGLVTELRAARAEGMGVSPRDVTAFRIMTCVHDFMPVLNQRWVLKGYAKVCVRCGVMVETLLMSEKSLREEGAEVEQ